jgi:hypothetical protein
MKLFVVCMAISATIPLSARADEKSTLETAWEILEKAEKWELLSLHPSPDLTQRVEKYVSLWILPSQIRFLSLYPEKADFHDWRILGKTTISDPKTRKALATSLFDGIVAGGEMREFGRDYYALARLCGPVVYEMKTGKLISSGGCFQPRHGIIAEHLGKRVELLICFECSEVDVFINGKTQYFDTCEFPHAAFEAVLKDAKVPFIPRAPEKK